MGFLTIVGIQMLYIGILLALSLGAAWVWRIRERHRLATLMSKGMIVGIILLGGCGGLGIVYSACIFQVMYLNHPAVKEAFGHQDISG